MSYRQVTTMVIKNLKRIAEGKEDKEKKVNFEQPSGQKRSKTSKADEQILHLIRGEKSCFMIGSNPDSQYKVPRIVGWDELEREERPAKTSYDSHVKQDTQKTKELVKTMKWEKHFRPKSMRKHASKTGYIRHDSILHPINCIEFHQWGNSRGRHYLGTPRWSLGALKQVHYGESQQLQHFKQRSTSLQVVAGTRVFVQNRNMSWNMGNVLSVWKTKSRLFYYRVAYEEDPLKIPGN